MSTLLVMLLTGNSSDLLVCVFMYLIIFHCNCYIYTVTDADGNIVVYQYQPEGKALLDNSN